MIVHIHGNHFSHRRNNYMSIHCSGTLFKRLFGKWSRGILSRMKRKVYRACFHYLRSRQLLGSTALNEVKKGKDSYSTILLSLISVINYCEWISFLLDTYRTLVGNDQLTYISRHLFLCYALFENDEVHKHLLLCISDAIRQLHRNLPLNNTSLGWPAELWANLWRSKTH